MSTKLVQFFGFVGNLTRVYSGRVNAVLRCYWKASTPINKDVTGALH